MPTFLTTTYRYLNPMTYYWNLNEIGVPPITNSAGTSNPTTQNPGFPTSLPFTGSFRKQVDWGGIDSQNRSGVYLVSDPANTCKIQFFTSQRTTGPATTGSIVYTVRSNLSTILPKVCLQHYVLLILGCIQILKRID